jgi:hypothetical protein
MELGGLNETPFEAGAYILVGSWFKLDAELTPSVTNCQDFSGVLSAWGRSDCLESSFMIFQCNGTCCVTLMLCLAGMDTRFMLFLKESSRGIFLICIPPLVPSFTEVAHMTAYYAFIFAYLKGTSETPQCPIASCSNMRTVCCVTSAFMFINCSCT